MTKKKKKLKLFGYIALGIIVLAILLFFFLNKKNTKPIPPIHERKINIISTHPIIQDALLQLATDRYNIQPLNKKQPQQQADLIIWLSPQQKEKEKQAQAKKVIVLSKAITQEQRLYYDKNTLDPHYYLDPKLWSKSLTKLSKYLIEIDPKHREYYQNLAQLYQLKLLALDQEIKRIFKKIPTQKRQFISSHPVFDYYAKAYNFQSMSLYTHAQPNHISTEKLHKISKKIQAKNIQLYIQVKQHSTHGGKNIQQLLRHQKKYYPFKTIDLSKTLNPNTTHLNHYLIFMTQQSHDIAKHLGNNIK
eukprot:COSAG01_NODE_61_length_29729_cov_196.711779_25_plen_304_part_00